MRIAVFGGTGRTGKPLIEQALAQGHEVVALVRNPARLGISNPKLTVVQGDATNAADVEKVVRDAEAVVSVLGPVKDSPENMLQTFARNLVNAMKAAGVRRVITLTGGGVPAPQDTPKLADKVFITLLRLVQPKVLADSSASVDIIKNSGLDYTIVRGPRLTDKPHSGNYRVGWAGSDGMKTSASRADIADFMLKNLTSTQYVGLMPMVSD